MMKFTTVLGAVAFALVSTACGNTADGVKKDAEIAAEKTADAASTAAAATDAAVQTAEIKTALMADTRVDAGSIDVDTNKDTKTVTLKGTVPADSMRSIAGVIAQGKASGYKIVNDLTVKK